MGPSDECQIPDRALRKAAVRSANQLRLLPTQIETTEFHATLQLGTSKKGTSLASRVLAQNGLITARHVDPDYRRRLEIEDLRMAAEAVLATPTASPVAN